MSDPLFDYSPSGASKTCRQCGTHYDLHGVDMEDSIPPVGDGCDECDPDYDDPDQLGVA